MAKAGVSAVNLENVETAQTRTPLARFLFALGILTILCAICAPLFVDRIAANAPKARDGYVSFSNWTSWGGPVELGGTWRLVWRAPVAAHGPNAGETVSIKVPGAWRGLRTGSAGVLPEMGLATYQLTIHGLKPGAYILFVPTVFHASQVWVNGHVVSRMGQVGDTAATTRYLWRAHEVQIESDGSDIHLAIDLAAFHHRNDGLEAAPVFGDASAMHTWLELEWSKDFLQISTLFLMFIYGLVVYSFRRSDYPSLFLALTYIAYIPTSMIIGHDNIIALIDPNINFTLMNAIGYFSSVFSIGLLLAYTAALFPNENIRPIYMFFQSVFVLVAVTFGVIFLLGDTILASYVFRYFMLFIIFVRCGETAA